MVLMILLLCGGDILPQLLQAPPRDLASLLDPKATLESMGAATDEASLITLVGEGPAVAPRDAELRQAVADLGARDFATRQRAARILKEAGAAARPFLAEAARSDDPEVSLSARELLALLNEDEQVAAAEDIAYVKKLLAIRLLEQMKSRRAVPALRAVADGMDVTLGAAAAEALAAIEGRPAIRRSGRAALKELAGRLPAETAFLAVLDFERGARVFTIQQWLAAIEKTLGDKGAAANGVVAHQFGPMLDRAESPLHQGVVRALATVGNIRLDAAAMVIPGNLSENDPQGVYVGWIFKGLWDPARLERCLAQGSDDERRMVGPHTVHIERHDGGFCCVDRHTLIIAVGEGRECRYVDRLVHALTSGETRTLDPIPARALTLIEKQDVRLAVSTSNPLSPELRAEGQRDLPRQIAREEEQAREGRPEEQLEAAAMKVVLAALNLTEAFGTLETRGNIVLQGKATDNGAARQVTESLKEFDAKLRQAIGAGGDQMPGWFRMLAAGMDKPLYAVEVQGDTVTVRGNLARAFSVSSVLLGLDRPRREPMVDEVRVIHAPNGARVEVRIQEAEEVRRKIVAEQEALRKLEEEAARKAAEQERQKEKAREGAR